MVQLAPKQKIIEFLNKEFSKIKAQRLQQQANKKLKTQAIEKQVRKLLRDIELILKIDSLDNSFNLKVMDFKKDIENYFL
jgi:predicted alpha/beta-fold hydrolase